MKFHDMLKKHRYSQRLTNLLTQINAAILEYYGKDKKALLLEALTNTPIYITTPEQNIYDTMKSLGYQLTKDDLHLKRSSGIYWNKPQIDYQDNKFVITDIKRAIVVIDYGIEELLIACLVHEISHLIKAYEEEYVIKGDYLYARSGLISEVSQLTYENGKVLESFISEKGAGLEETSNTYDEENIMRIFLNPNYCVQENYLMNAFVRHLIDELDIIKDIHHAQFHNQKAFLRQKLNPSLYDSLEGELDVMYQDYMKYASNNRKFVVFQKNKIVKVTTPLLDQMKGVIKSARTPGS